MVEYKVPAIEGLPIGFDYACFGDRYFRFPLYMLYERSLCSMQRKTEALNETMANRKFCSMVVSNPNADPSRELFFFLLSQYKRVDSGGRYLNNIDCLNGVPSKYEFQKTISFQLHLKTVLIQDIVQKK